MLIHQLGTNDDAFRKKLEESIQQTDRVSQTWWCRPAIQAIGVAETGGSPVQVLLELENEVKTSLGNLVRPCLQIIINQKKLGVVA